jgi:hypothetical protein
MSCYEWESGTIKIPSADWAKTKAAVREAVNRRQTALFEVAERVHKELSTSLPELKKDLKAKKITEWDLEKKLDQIIDRHMDAVGNRHGGRHGLFDEYDGSEIEDKVVITRDPKTRAYVSPRLRKPLKKDFPLAGNNVGHFTAGDCAVVFDNDKKTARWEVYENNHAVEHARATALGIAFFKAMEKITWTRDSGGKIIGNDEYNRDSGREYEGGGGSYLKQTFSAEQQKKDREAAARSRSYGYGGYGYGYGGFRR